MKTPHYINTNHITELFIDPYPLEIGFRWQPEVKKTFWSKGKPEGVYYWGDFFSKDVPSTMYLEGGELRVKPRIVIIYGEKRKFFSCDSIEIAESRLASIKRMITLQEFLDISYF